jgi:hypothetical protein
VGGCETGRGAREGLGAAETQACSSKASIVANSIARCGKAERVVMLGAASPAAPLLSISAGLAVA